MTQEELAELGAAYLQVVPGYDGEQCPRCDGDRIVADRPCSDCDGTGDRLIHVRRKVIRAVPLLIAEVKRLREREAELNAELDSTTRHLAQLFGRAPELRAALKELIPICASDITKEHMDRLLALVNLPTSDNS